MALRISEIDKNIEIELLLNFSLKKGMLVMIRITIKL